MTGRAILAIIFLIGFYLLAFGIVGVLLYIPYAEMLYLGRIHLQIVAFCLIGAILILWGLLPRRSPFIAPGPRLAESDQPRLFKEIRDIAKATGQEMPAEVYLLAEPNAWVMDRRNFLGLGSARIMGIGLPLLQILDIPQTQAVLAHEFGHFYSGDTTLGPWIYTTRAMLERTLEGLRHHSSVLQQPFIWYGKAFLRITHAISRQQEYTADALAASIVGRDALISGLTAISTTQPAFHQYWRSEVIPVLDRGYRPPLMSGFQAYIQSPYITAVRDKISQVYLADKKSDPYDTHPSLSERIAALQQYLKKDTQREQIPAISLLDNIAALEGEILIALANEKSIQALKPIQWEETTDTIWIGIWKEMVTAAAGDLAGITPSMIPDILASSDRRAMLFRHCETPVPTEYQQLYLIDLFGSAITLALIQQGWIASTLPGEEVTLYNDRASATPFLYIANLIDEKKTGEKMSAEEWHMLCTDLDIRNVDLGAMAAQQKPARS